VDPLSGRLGDPTKGNSFVDPLWGPNLYDHHRDTPPGNPLGGFALAIPLQDPLAGTTLGILPLRDHPWCTPLQLTTLAGTSCWALYGSHFGSGPVVFPLFRTLVGDPVWYDKHLLNIILLKPPKLITCSMSLNILQSYLQHVLISKVYGSMMNVL
jgi:hypothetical protein